MLMLRKNPSRLREGRRRAPPPPSPASGRGSPPPCPDHHASDKRRRFLPILVIDARNSTPSPACGGGWGGGTRRRGSRGPIVTAVRYICGGSSLRNCATCSFQNSACRWVKWPYVFSLAGTRTYLALGMRLISRSVTPSCGGLVSSSPELIAISRALIFSRCGAGL